MATKQTIPFEPQVLALPYAVRAELASRLLTSLDARGEDHSPEVEQAWLALAADRYEALRRGDDPGLTHEEVFASLRTDAH